jgi:hypothetical protein
VVVDVAEVVALLGVEAGELADVVDGAGGEVALRRDHASQRDEEPLEL